MRIEIPYGGRLIPVEFNASTEVLLPKKVDVKDEKDVLFKALDQPLGRESFKVFLEESNHLLVIVNDATRPTPTAKILGFLSPMLQEYSNDLGFLVATGSHRAPTEEELKTIFGETYDVFKEYIHIHDARSRNLVYRGRSSRGTEIYVNPLVLDYGNIIVIGSVEPHYFAGYTGGRKSFLPGVCGYKTIEMNHSFALEREAQTFALNGNPVHEDMMEVASRIMEDLNVFSIQTVVTMDGKIYAVTAGDLHSSFEAAIPYANEVFSVPLKHKGNIVLSAASPPLDVNLYQSQKALDNGKLALEEDGILILVSKCHGGVGDETFLRLLSQASNPSEVHELIKRGYKLGYHKAAKIAEVASWAQLWAVTDLDEDVIRKALMKPYKVIQEAVDDAISIIMERGEEPYIVILPEGSVTVPRIN